MTCFDFFLGYLCSDESSLFVISCLLILCMNWEDCTQLFLSLYFFVCLEVTHAKSHGMWEKGR